MSLLKEIKKMEKEMDAQGFTPEQKLQYKLWQEAIRKENNIVGEDVMKLEFRYIVGGDVKWYLS